jgi:hypothetical protein
VTKGERGGRRKGGEIDEEIDDCRHPGGDDGDYARDHGRSRGRAVLLN